MLLIVEIDILVDTFNLNIVFIISFSTNYSIIDINPEYFLHLSIQKN